MPNPYLLIAAALMIGIALGASAVKLYDYRHRIQALEDKVAKLSACSKHDLKHITRADVGEAFLFDFARLREDVQVMANRLENFTQHAQHVAAGGSPDDPPSTWKE
jgi:hypothetical protein